MSFLLLAFFFYEVREIKFDSSVSNEWGKNVPGHFQKDRSYPLGLST